MKHRIVSVILAGMFIVFPVWADLTSAIAKIKPSVVLVGTYKGTNSPRFSLRGTGFVVGNGNLVVTNAHVMPQPADQDLDATVVVHVRDAQDELKMRGTTVLEVDKTHDLALLRIDGPAAPALSLRDSDLVQEGQAVAFTGFPIGGALGYSPVTHRGMISSIAAMALPTANSQQLNARTIRSLRGGSFHIFQLDGTAYPGNSGGPLFDPETAEVLGVVNMVFIKGTREAALTHPSGISYAIPSKFVAQMLERATKK